MEQVPLLQTQNQADSSSFWVEVKKLCHLSVPMIVLTSSQYLICISPIFILGHVSNLSLSGVSIATSIANVTGYSIIYGMATALETLCGQAYGAEQYHMVGNYTFTGIICLFLASIPISIMWMYMDKLLIFVGQEVQISIEAGKYTLWLIPSLFPYAIYQSLVMYLQIQSMILPMVLSTLAALCFQLPLLWLVIFKFKLGSPGAALSINISYWLNAIILVIYVKYSPACKKTHLSSFTTDIVRKMRHFLSLAIPAALMVCLVWWSYEAAILFSGFLPNPQIETSVVNICFTTVMLHYNIPESFGAVASTQISNALGAGKPKTARMAFYAATALSIIECVTASTIIFALRNVLGYLYSNDEEIIDYVNDISFLLSLGVVVDGFEAVLAGIIRGSGRQNIAVYVNFVSYYLVGTPIALLLGFVLHYKGKGLWCGLLAGGTLECLSFLVILSCANWEKQAIEARKRIFEDGWNGE